MVEKTLIDLQLDQACRRLDILIKSGKILPDFNKIWRDFARKTCKQTRQTRIKKG